MEFRIYNELNKELEQIWTDLYLKVGATYSLSYDWCKIWYKHFGEGKKIFIITGWEENKLKLIAPFYKTDRLHLFGTNPDFLDLFDVIYEDDNALFELVNFIFEHNFQMDILFIDSEHKFFKYFIRKNENEKLYNIKIAPYTLRPLVFKEKMLNHKFKEITRKNRIARNEFNDEIAYEFSPKKTNELFDEFLYLHHQKWDALKVKEKSEFLRDVYLNCDFVNISRLFLKKKNITLAYDFKFTPSNKVLYYNICAFNPEYSILSPGSIIFCHEIMSELFPSIKYLDFGNGVLDYKYRYCHAEKMILNMQVKHSWKRHKHIYYPLKKIKERIHSYGI